MIKDKSELSTSDHHTHPPPQVHVNIRAIPCAKKWLQDPRQPSPTSINAARCRQLENRGVGRRHNNHLLPCSPDLLRHRRKNLLSTVLLGRTSARVLRESTTENNSTAHSAPARYGRHRTARGASPEYNNQSTPLLPPARYGRHRTARREPRVPTTNQPPSAPSPVRATSYSPENRQATTNQLTFLPPARYGRHRTARPPAPRIDKRQPINSPFCPQPGTGDIVQLGAPAPHAPNRQATTNQLTFLPPARYGRHRTARGQPREPTSDNQSTHLSAPSPVRATSYSSGRQPREPTTNQPPFCSVPGTATS